MPVVAAVLLLMGFAGITIGPNLDALPAARALVLAGLAITGLGVGMIYTAAFYYAMEVGDAEIDAGGKHEAFIGLGYLGGPVVGLIAYGAAQPHGPLSVTPSLLLLVIAGAIVVVLGLGSVVWAVASGRRDRDEEHPEGL
jgi:MFS family permease